MNDNTLTCDNTPSGSSSFHVAERICYDEVLASLAIEVSKLRNEVKELMIKRLMEAESVPESIATSTVNEHIKKKYKLGRPPMESEIIDAIKKTKDMTSAAEYLGISVDTLKRYCDYFSSARGGTPLWQPRRGTKAIKPFSITEEQSISSSTMKVKPSAFASGSFFNL